MSDRPRLLYLHRMAYLPRHENLPAIAFIGAKVQPHQACTSAESYPERRFSSYTKFIELLRNTFDVEFSRGVLDTEAYDALEEVYKPLYMESRDFAERSYHTVIGEGATSRYTPLPAPVAQSFSASGGLIVYLTTGGVSTDTINGRFNRYLRNAGFPSLTREDAGKSRPEVEPKRGNDNLSWLTGMGPSPNGGTSTLHAIEITPLYTLRLPQIAREAFEGIDLVCAEHSLDVTGDIPLVYGCPGTTSTLLRSDVPGTKTPHTLAAFRHVGEGGAALVTGHLASDLDHEDFGSDGPQLLFNIVDRLRIALDNREKLTNPQVADRLHEFRIWLETCDWTPFYKNHWLTSAQTDRLSQSMEEGGSSAVYSLSAVLFSILRKIGEGQLQDPENPEELHTEKQMLQLGAIALGERSSKSVMSNACGIIERKEEIQSGLLPETEQLVLGVEILGLLNILEDVCDQQMASRSGDVTSSV